MIKFFTKKNIITLAVMVFLFGLTLINLNFVFAQDYGNYGLDNTVNNVNLPGTTEIKSGGQTAKSFFSGKLGQVIGFFLAFTGVAFMVLMIVAGTIWMNAQGNEQAVTKAKDLMIAAVIGLIITIAAYSITKLLGGVLLSTSP